MRISECSWRMPSTAFGQFLREIKVFGITQGCRSLNALTDSDKPQIETRKHRIVLGTCTLFNARLSASLTSEHRILFVL